MVNIIIALLLCICGLLLHFLTSWWKCWMSNGRISPTDFLMLEPPKWAVATVGAIVCMLLLKSIPVFFNMDIEAASSVEILKVLAFASGYMGSSIAAAIAGAVGDRLRIKRDEDQ